MVLTSVPRATTQLILRIPPVYEIMAINCCLEETGSMPSMIFWSGVMMWGSRIVIIGARKRRHRYR